MKFTIEPLKLLLLIPIVIVVVLALNPGEVANKKRDEMYMATARHFQEAAKDYFAKQNTTASYGFVTADKLGLEALALNSGDKFITENISNFYIGREKGIDSVTYVCYLPLSKFNRDAACNDKRVYTLNQTNGTRNLVDCTLGSNWQVDDKPWMICLPN